jgi:hypothetical protein
MLIYLYMIWSQNIRFEFSSLCLLVTPSCSPIRTNQLASWCCPLFEAFFLYCLDEMKSRNPKRPSIINHPSEWHIVRFWIQCQMIEQIAFSHNLAEDRCIHYVTASPATSAATYSVTLNVTTLDVRVCCLFGGATVSTQYYRNSSRNSCYYFDFRFSWWWRWIVLSSGL